MADGLGLEVIAPSQGTGASFAVGITVPHSGVLQPPLPDWNIRGARFVPAWDRRTSHCVISGSGDGPKYHRAAGGLKATPMLIDRPKGRSLRPSIGGGT
jgi:hypothetical protein